MPKLVDHDARKRAIVENALDLFAQKGFIQTTFNDIASECGLSRTSLYQYFKSKDEIFLYAVEGALGKISSGISSIAQSNISAAEKLQRAFDTFIEESEHGKHAPIILELALKMKRENVTIAERLDLAAKNLYFAVSSLLNSFECRLEQYHIPMVSNLFFALVESVLIKSLFIDSKLARDQLFELLKLMGC